MVARRSIGILTAATLIAVAVLAIARSTPAMASGGEGGGAPPVNWTDMGYGDKDTHGGAFEKDKGDEPMAPPLVFALLNFALFAGLLVWKAGPALTDYFKKRHETIKSALSEAARLREEAREKLDECTRRIADVDSEVAELIGQIRAEAEGEKARILAEAKRQADMLKRDAEERIEAEMHRARRELEREVVLAAAAAAEATLREKTSASDQSALFDGFIADISNPAVPKPPVSPPTPATPSESPTTDEGWD